MAEIGIVASIIGVAGAGFRLSLILNAISCEVAQAPLEIHHISKSVTLFSLMLKQIGNVLQAAESVHSHEAVEAAKQVAEESGRVFDEINDMLDRVRSKKDDGSSRPSAQQRIKWCFKKSRITYLLSQLESLKLSLSLMLQILQLGKLMALTSKSDPPEMVKEKSAAIKQERVEAQNILIVRYMQINETEQLYRSCREDGSAPQSPIEYKDDTDNDSKLTIKPPPEYTSSMSLVHLPPHSLGDIDSMLQGLDQSSKDMVRISDKAIDPLLEKWTRWHEVREQRHSRYPGAKYTPTVHSLQEDDLPYYERFADREESPKGYYLEGTTTDWRRPNSVAARREYSELKKQYAAYQASVSAHSSDQEDSPASNASSRRNTKHHVLNSSSESEDSESKLQKSKRSVKFQPGPPLDRPQPKQSTPPSSQPASRMPPSPAQSAGSKASVSPQYIVPHSGRPAPTPDQNAVHHSLSMPLPPVYTHNPTNPYAYTQHPPSPAYHHHPPHFGPGGGLSPSRTYPPPPNRMGAPPRPISRDGKPGRSPSRLSQEFPRDRDWDRERDREREQDRDRDRDQERNRDYSRHERSLRDRDSKSKNLRDGATKGLLGAAGIYGFLEMLEGLAM